MIATDPSPSTGRIVAAFLVAPWASSLVVVLLSAPSGVRPDVMLDYFFSGPLYGSILAYVTVLVFGLPLLLCFATACG